MGLDGQRRPARGGAADTAEGVRVALAARCTPCLGKPLASQAPAAPGCRTRDGGNTTRHLERVNDMRGRHRPAQKGETEGSGRVAPRTGARGDPESR